MGRVDNIYPVIQNVTDTAKIAEFTVGTDRKPAEIANMVEFISSCIHMCHLEGDLPTRWTYIGDTLTFYKVFFVFKEYILPIRYN